MSVGTQTVQQQTQDEQYLQQAQDFFGQSMGRIKGRMQSDSAQLQSFMQQLPAGHAQAQIQEMIDSYSEIEGSMDQAAQDSGVEDVVSQAAQQTQRQMQEVAEGVAQQAQDTAGQAAGQAQDAAGGATQQAQNAVGGLTGGGQQGQEQGGGSLGGVTDQVGEVAGQARETAGGAVQQAQDGAAQATQQAPGGEDQQPDATNAAQQKAQELGVDLSQMQGSGAEGRITIRDVIGSSNQ